MKYIGKIGLIALFITVTANTVFSQALSNFNVKTVGNTSPTGMYYAEYLPPGFDTSTKVCGFPMMIVLHGIGEKGPNDGSQLHKVTVHGPPKHIKNGHNMCFTVNGKEECFVVIAPQLDIGNWTPPRIKAHYDAILADTNVGPKIDTNRVYLTGLSLGAIGTYWHMINPVHNRPNVFAAFAPIAGNASTTIGCSFTNLNVPMWAFHGDRDNTVPYSQDTALFNNIMACTTPPPTTEFKFTTYPNVGHNSWSRAYDTGHTYQNPNLYEWLLTKTLPATTNSCGGLNNVQLSQSQICLGDTITATHQTASFTDFYWELDGNQISTAATVKISPSVGNHTLRVVGSDCSCIVDTSFSISVQNGPIAGITANGPTSICNGDSLTLTSDTTIDNTWVLNGNVLSSNSSIVVNTEGNYQLIVDHNIGCADTTALFIDVNDSIVPVISYDSSQLTSTVATSYQWYRNDSLISGANGRNYLPTTNGTYKVRTQDTNGCFASSADFELTYLGISGPVAGLFEVFPNPASGKIEHKIEFKSKYRCFSQIARPQRSGNSAQSIQ